MGTMYDSVTASDIPADALIVAGYVDGAYTWSEADWAQFPGAAKVRIAVSASSHDAQVLDVENGDATPDQAPEWAVAVRALGFAPTIYTSRDNVATVAAAFSAADVPQPYYWVADWTGTAHLIPNSVATQYANPPASGGHYDVSTTLDTWPVAPVAPSPPAPQEPTAMQVYSYNVDVIISGGAGWVASPVPVASVVNCVVLDENPDHVGHYDAIPAFIGAATQTGSHSPNGALVFSGTASGTYALVIWSTQAPS
jgi:hypothetical protein